MSFCAIFEEGVGPVYFTYDQQIQAIRNTVFDPDGLAIGDLIPVWGKATKLQTRQWNDTSLLGAKINLVVRLTRSHYTGWIYLLSRGRRSTPRRVASMAGLRQRRSSARGKQCQTAIGEHISPSTERLQRLCVPFSPRNQSGSTTAWFCFPDSNAAVKTRWWSRVSVGDYTEGAWVLKKSLQNKK